MGALPASRFLLKARVPRDVIVHWSRWGREGRFSRWSGEDSPGFSAFTGPLLGMAVADDDYAPPPAVDALLRNFPGAGSRRVILDPRQHGGGSLGHFGLLSGKAPAWARGEVLGWLEELRLASSRRREDKVADHS